jgi:ATP-dependent exoDNAse (exonuclease V) alpha subunit
VVDPERRVFANGVFLHVGDQIQFKKNSRPLGVDNADLGTVTGVDPDRGRLSARLVKDGREVTVDFKRYSAENVRLGYALTNYAAQGASLPHVHCLMGGSTTDLHEGYVQVSRHTKTSHLFVDKHTAGGPELADLLRSLARSRQKTLAQEIVDRERKKQLEVQQPPPQQRHEAEVHPPQERRSPSIRP